MNPEVWIVTEHPKRGASEDPVVKQAIREAEDQGWPNRVSRQPVIRDGAGKPFCVLKPADAHQLYRRAHTARVVVWATTEVWVQTNPTRKRLDPESLIQLARLIRYKACFVRVSAGNLSQAVAAFEKWKSHVDCDDDRDPRVLPLHTFCPSDDVSDLDTSTGQSRFKRDYGGPSERICEQALSWTPDPSRHGGQKLEQQVAGRILSRGYHWDVRSPRRQTTLRTLTEVFKIQPHGHVNAYPNGHVRPGQRARMVNSISKSSGRRSSK